MVVLAAGRGRRMGGPKALMLVDGEPWWRWQERRLCGYGLVPHWVVSADVAAAIDGHESTPRWLVTSDPDAPMFVSVLLGLASAPDVERGVFILPVDTPAPRVEHWRVLAESASPAHPEFEGKGGHPLFLPGEWIRASLGERLARVRARGIDAADHADRLDKLVEGARLAVPIDDPAVVCNLNTPADVEAWRRSVGESPR